VLDGDRYKIADALLGAAVVVIAALIHDVSASVTLAAVGLALRLGKIAWDRRRIKKLTKEIEGLKPLLLVSDR
jgi:hypothetical protein